MNVGEGGYRLGFECWGVSEDCRECGGVWGGRGRVEKVGGVGIKEGVKFWWNEVVWMSGWIGEVMKGSGVDG